MKSNLYLRSCFASASLNCELDESTLWRIEDQLAQQQHMSHDKATSRSRPAYRVLIVEADHEIASALQSNFERAGLQVQVAKNSTQILDIFRAHTPHLVLLDSTISGIETDSLCRSMRASCDVPIMFIANDTSALHESNFRSGLDSFALKRFGADLLAARVIAHLRWVYRCEHGHIYRKQDPAQAIHNHGRADS